LFVRAQRRPLNPILVSGRLRSIDGRETTVFQRIFRSVTTRSSQTPTIWFTAADQGRENLFTVPSSGGVRTCDQCRVDVIAAPRGRLCDCVEIDADGAC
jgi:hypothetical protein